MSTGGNGSAPWPASGLSFSDVRNGLLCRKRPFAIHADRLRPRLEGGRLPAAGPAARRSAGRLTAPLAGQPGTAPAFAAAKAAVSGNASPQSFHQPFQVRHAFHTRLGYKAVVDVERVGFLLPVVGLNVLRTVPISDRTSSLPGRPEAHGPCPLPVSPPG